MFSESILLWSGLWGEVLLKSWTTLFAFGDFGGEANGAMFFGYKFELDYLESIHLNLIRTELNSLDNLESWLSIIRIFNEPEEKIFQSNTCHLINTMHEIKHIL